MHSIVSWRYSGCHGINSIIDPVEDKVAADATHAVNFVANGISSPDAMLTTASSVANFAPKESTSPISSAAVTKFLLLRQGITRFVRDARQQAVDEKRRTLTIEVKRRH